MPVRRIAAPLILAAFAASGQAALDDATIGRLVKAGVAEQTIVAMIGQQPGKYALSWDDMMALKSAGVSDTILAAMRERNAAASGSPAPEAPADSNLAITPTVLALRDATAIRLRLVSDLTFTNVKPGDRVVFEILDDLRIGGVLVMARGGRVTATITEAEPKTRMGRGGKLGVNLDSVPLLNGDKVTVRAASERRKGGPADVVAVAAEAVVKPAAPSLLFTYGKDEVFPQGTRIVVYSDGESRLDPAGFLLDIAFTSNPPDAQVNMYGAVIGRTPFTTRFATGTYTAVFSAGGYADVTQTIAVGPGHANAVQVVFKSRP